VLRIDDLPVRHREGVALQIVEPHPGVISHTPVLHVAAGIGGMEGVESDAEMRVGVGNLDQERARPHLQRQLFANFPPQRVRQRFARLHLAAGEFPQPAEQAIERPLGNQKLALA